jgi:hypothetical protein
MKQILQTIVFAAGMTSLLMIATGFPKGLSSQDGNPIQVQQKNSPQLQQSLACEFSDLRETLTSFLNLDLTNNPCPPGAQPGPP